MGGAHGGAAAVEEGAHRAFLTDRYAGEAQAYAWLWAPVIGRKSRRLLAALPLERACCVVDLGAGTGFLLPHLRAAAPAALVVGADLTLEMLRQARARGEETVAVMDARRLALPAACADAVVAAFMLFHLPDPRAALAEAHRVLRPGGWCGVSVWGRRRQAAVVDAVTALLDREGVPADEPDPNRSDALLNSPGKLGAVLGAAGLADVRAWVESLDHRWEADRVAASITEYGTVARRLAALPADRREALAAQARRLVAGVAPDALVDRSTVVFAVGRRPAR